MSVLLAADDLTLVRGGRVLAAGLTFAIPEGGALLIAGPNGAGKTSLMRVLAGLGRIAGGGVALPPRRALLGERDALDGDRTLAEALAFWARLDGRAAAVAEALEAVALAHLADVPVRLLSTGQRRRAAFARVLASGAALWLLDEPASGVDAGAMPLLEAAVARHRAGGGVAVVATHQAFALPGAQVVTLGGEA